MVQTNKLTFQYKKDEHTFSFPDINLKENENVLILGKSGIGKTTLLHLLAELLKPTTGKVTINNLDLDSLSNNTLDIYRGKHIGLVFQKKHAVQSLSVIDNLKARLMFSKRKIDTVAIERLLEQLGLLDYKNKRILALSEGQLQRLGIALSVVHCPKVVLADEPTSSLDDENCTVVMELLLEQAKQTNANLIVITHDQRVKPFFTNTITL